DRPARLFVAAWLDGVRLIDNLPVQPRQAAQAPGPRPVEPA
ncbi:pantoate--beta-alanine ligase, partial [Pseudooceanicola lipolyticus]